MIRVNNLTVRYGKIVAVQNVSFEVERGEIVAILGPNGAGKSSIIKSIVGIVEYEGRIEVQGVDARKNEAKNLFGYVAEEVNLIDHLTPEEFFSFVASIRGIDDIDRAETLIKAFKLGNYMDRPIASLSMGNKKKVAVVAALLHDPPYLILDEPLNGLDAMSARILKDLTSKMALSGGVLLSTHIMEIAEKMADRIVVLDRGRIVAEGTLDELRSIAGGNDLEEVFLKLTGQYESVKDIVSAI